MNSQKLISKSGIMLAAGFFLLNNSYFNINAGHSGIIFNYFTGIKSNRYNEGFHLKLPFIEKPIIYNVRTQSIDEKSSTNNRELQMVDFQVRVLYKANANNLSDLYKKWGMNYKEKLLSDCIREISKTVIAQFTAQELISNREQVSFAIKNNLYKKLVNFNIILEDVSITHLNFSPEYSKKIEEKQIAQQEAERAKYLVEKSKQKKKGVIIKAEAYAKNIELFGKIIQENPAYLILKRIEYSKEISDVIKNSRNKFILNSNNLLLNMKFDSNLIN